jgi:hypothetical protein
MESILNVTVSYYPNFWSNSIDCNLLEYLQFGITKLNEKVDYIRTKKTKDERDALKKPLPGITPSAICRPSRSLENLVTHSGLAIFDIDKIAVENMAGVFDKIISIPYVAYCGLSVSGTGYWGLVPISNKAKHLQHFDALEFLFREYGIDKPLFDRSAQDISRFRFYSYDKNAYFNHKAEVFTYLYEAPVKPKKAYSPGVTNSTESNSFNDFNKNGNVESLLVSHGWVYQPRSDKGSRRRYTRPGKSKGTSADWCIERRILYIFTDATELAPSTGYNPVNVFCALETGGNWSECSRKLKSMGFGLSQ